MRACTHVRGCTHGCMREHARACVHGHEIGGIWHARTHAARSLHALPYMPPKPPHPPLPT